MQCINCGEKAKSVDIKTVRLHLKKPWETEFQDEKFFYCKTQSCDIVYFGNKDSRINKDKLRRTIGVKDSTDNRQLCYCFNVTLNDILDEKEKGQEGDIKTYVTEQSRAGHCACEINNPAGRCCLVDFPKEKK